MLDRRAAIRRAMEAHAHLNRDGAGRERARGTVAVAIASPTMATTAGRRPTLAKLGTTELRSPLAVLDKNSPERFAANGGGARTPGEARRRGKSRLARARSASEETLGRAATEREDGFEAVEAFEEVLGRIGAKAVLSATQRRALEEIYEESLEARSLRVVLENVKDSELALAHAEATARNAWAKSLEEASEEKWATRVEETEKENAKLRLDAHKRDVELVAAKAEAKRLRETRAEKPKLVNAVVQTETEVEESSVHKREITAKDAEILALRRELDIAKTQMERETRAHAEEFDALQDELAKTKEASERRRERELAQIKDRAAFFERCSHTADERANGAEATAHALREEFLMIESEVKKLKEQMARNAEHAAEEKESIMSALAAAQARASESENAPLAQRLSLPEALISGEMPCKCGSVATAQRLSAALADSTTRNTELQAKVTMLENKLEMRSIGDVLDKEQVEALEERARAAERRVSVARTAMTRYVSESQKCSPAPFVYSTVDDLTPMKRAVENWMEFSEAKHANEEDEKREEDEKEEEDKDSDDEFDSPGRHRGMLPTPRLRARVAIRLTHGPAPKLPPGAYKPTSDEELRRRAKVMGLSVSPFGRR